MPIVLIAGIDHTLENRQKVRIDSVLVDKVLVHLHESEHKVIENLAERSKAMIHPRIHHCFYDAKN